MSTRTISPAGLAVATAMSGSNIFTDVARKKAVLQRQMIPVTFWCELVAAFVYGLALWVRYLMGAHLVFHDGGNLFGIAALHLSPIWTYVIYLAIDVLIVSICNLLYFKALQVSPLSLTIPFLAFTPIFLIPAGFIMLGEMPSYLKLVGVVVIVAGSVLMHRRVFAQGWTAPFKAIINEKGSRYILIVALLFSLTNPIEKKLVMISDTYFQAFAFGLGVVGFFLIATIVRGDDFRGALQGNVAWISVAGTLNAISLILQYASYYYVDVVIAITIKRAGIVLAVVFGWLFFRERSITDKLIGCSVMVAGIVIIYLPVNALQTALITAFTAAAAGVALYATRNRGESSVAEAAPKPASETGT